MSPMSTPFDSKVHLIKNHADSVLQDKYAQIILSQSHYVVFKKFEHFNMSPMSNSF